MKKSILSLLLICGFLFAQEDTMIKEVAVYSFNTTDKAKIQQVFNDRNSWLKTLDGFVSIETIKSNEQKNQYIDVVVWEDTDSQHKAMKLFENVSFGAQMMQIMDLNQTFIMSSGSIVSESKK